MQLSWLNTQDSFSPFTWTPTNASTPNIWCTCTTECTGTGQTEPHESTPRSKTRSLKKSCEPTGQSLFLGTFWIPVLALATLNLPQFTNIECIWETSLCMSSWANDTSMLANFGKMLTVNQNGMRKTRWQLIWPTNSGPLASLQAFMTGS